MSSDINLGVGDWSRWGFPESGSANQLVQGWPTVVTPTGGLLQTPLPPVDPSDPSAKRLPIRRHHAPTIDIAETESAYLVSVDFPGVKKEDLKVQFEQGSLLTIAGERKVPQERKQAIDIYNRPDRFFGRYSRTLQLPRDADSNQLTAKYEDGVLYITINKIPRESRPAQGTIDIQ